MKVIIAAGGTGGHIFPALNLGKFLREKGIEVVFVGRKGSIEENYYKRNFFQMKYIDVEGFKGKGIKNKLISIFKLFKEFSTCLRILKDVQPDIVIGFGGYISFPLIFISRILGIKNGICEQNAVMGASNRLSSMFVEKIFLNFVKTEKVPSIFKKEICGNFLKREIKEVSKKEKEKTKKILVFGGSQGAEKINELVVNIVDAFKDMNIKLIHLTGEKHYENIKNMYEVKKIDFVKVIPFSDQMEKLYEEVELVISRAGATSITEFFALRMKAILIPFPYATDNHQWYNACEYAKTGKAVVLDQRYLNKEKLIKWIKFFIENDKRFDGNWNIMGDPTKSYEKIYKWITG